MWTLYGAATILVFGRLLIRWTQRKLNCDDVLNGTALLFLLSYGVVQQVLLSVYSVATTANELTVSTILTLVYNLIWWTVPLLVKASFLATYRKIFMTSRVFRVAWWIVTVYTVITFFALFLGQLWVCGGPSEVANFVACSDPSLNRREANDLWWWMALNVFGYLLIMALPLSVLFKLKLSSQQRLSLVAIFAITIINVLFDIIRTVYGVQLLRDPSSMSAVLYQLPNILTVVEPAVAVIVCTLPTYRTLLPNQSKKREKTYKLLHTGCGGRNMRSKHIPNPPAANMELGISRRPDRCQL